MSSISALRSFSVALSNDVVYIICTTLVGPDYQHLPPPPLPYCLDDRETTELLFNGKLQRISV